MDIHSVYQNLAHSVSSESDHDQDAPAASMGDLQDALQQVEQPRGTLADAWRPRKHLQFETDIATVSQEVLVQRTVNVPQASSDNPEQILDNLRKWRDKYLSYIRKAGATNSDLRNYRDGVEALRAKALLLYRKSQQEVRSSRAGGRRGAHCSCYRGSSRHSHAARLLAASCQRTLVVVVGRSPSQRARASCSWQPPWTLPSAPSPHTPARPVYCPAGCCWCCWCCWCWCWHASTGAQQGRA
jgi:hypothetical protein